MCVLSCLYACLLIELGNFAAVSQSDNLTDNCLLPIVENNMAK